MYSATALLTNVDRLSRVLAPVDAMINLIGDRLNMQRTAKACSIGGHTVTCRTYCEYSDRCCPGGAGHHLEKFVEKSTTISACSWGDVQTCSDGCQTSCGQCPF